MYVYLCVYISHLYLNKSEKEIQRGDKFAREYTTEEYFVTDSLQLLARGTNKNQMTFS